MTQELPLAGVRTRALALHPDERGFFAEALRRDWQDFVDEWVVQSNLSYGFPGTVRAWHRHARGQVDYFLVVQGALKICAYDEGARHLVEVVSSARAPTLVRVPGHYWHGSKVVGPEPALAVYFVTRLYDYQQPDEERRPWNDADVIPALVNGRADDPRAGRPWDWLRPPHA